MPRGKHGRFKITGLLNANNAPRLKQDRRLRYGMQLPKRGQKLCQIMRCAKLNSSGWIGRGLARRRFSPPQKAPKTVCRERPANNLARLPRLLAA